MEIEDMVDAKIKKLSRNVDAVELQFTDFKGSISSLDKKLVELQKLRVIITNIDSEFK